MAKQAGPMADVLLKRIYAYGGIAHSVAEAIATLSRCQRTVNAFTRSIVTTGTLTTKASKLLYTLRTEFSDLVDCLELTVGTGSTSRRLLRCPTLPAFDAYSTTWFRDTGSRFEAWKQLGRDLLLVYPALTSGSSLTVRYSKYVNELVDATTAFELPDEEVDLVLDLAEIVLLARDREIDRAREKIQKLTEGLALELTKKA